MSKPISFKCPGSNCKKTLLLTRDAEFGAPKYNECTADQPVSHLMVYCVGCASQHAWHRVFGLTGLMIAEVLGLDYTQVKVESYMTNDLMKWLIRSKKTMDELILEMPPSIIDPEKAESMKKEFDRELETATPSSITKRQ